jgi:signal transduction histidine kinase/streptogramin lyase
MFKPSKYFQIRLQVILLSALALLYSLNLAAQSFSFKHYTVEDGLNTSTVYYATQDLQGNMWFATEQGVCKFDGKTFTRYTINDGLSDNEVLLVKTDRKGRIWFLTFNGHLSFYYNGKFFNEQNTGWLKKTFVGTSYQSCFETSDGTLLIGLTIIKNDTDVSILGSIGSASYFENPDKTISIYAPDTNSFLFDGLKNTIIKTKYYCTRSNCISNFNKSPFYMSVDGLIKKEGANEEVLIPVKEMFPASAVTGVNHNKDGSFVVTSRNGVIWYPKGIFQKSKAFPLLTNKTVYSHFVDNENNFWFCTDGDGIYMIPSSQKKYLNYTSEDGLANEVINRIVKDRKGNLWLACNNSVMTRISAKGVENIVLHHPKIRNSRVLDIAIDAQENIYAATDGGIIKLNSNNRQELIPLLTPFGSNTGYAAKTVSINNNSYITTTLAAGIYQLTATARKSKKLFAELLWQNGLRTYTHYVDRSNNLWVATISGFCLSKKDGLKYFMDKDSLLNNRITNIAEAPDSTLLLSTNGCGILFFKDGKIINHFNEANGLSSNACRRLFIRGNILWISTFQGLTKCIYRNNSISDIHIFNANNGLLSNSVKDVYDNGDKIYVATEKGLCIMENLTEEDVSSSPPLYITDLTYSGMRYSTDTVLEFKISSPVKINFNAVTFQNSSELKYRYRISKLNNKWIETKNNSVEYSFTGSGKYDFEVQAKKVNSEWSKTAGISFMMIPPFYKTTWFYFLITAGAGFLVYYLTRMVTQQRFRKQLAVARQNEMIVHERMRIASDMHDDIGADLTQISIWSNILNSTAKNEIIGKIVNSSNDVLQKVDSIIWALDSVHDSAEDLISYLRNYALNFLEMSDISFSFDSVNLKQDIKLSATQRRNIYLVIKELLHNTVKHSGASTVEMQMSNSDTDLIIKYSDNGKGFDASSLGDGLGFTTLQQRMTDIDSVFKFNSEPGKGFSAELIIKV